MRTGPAGEARAQPLTLQSPHHSGLKSAFTSGVANPCLVSVSGCMFTARMRDDETEGCIRR